MSGSRLLPVASALLLVGCGMAHVARLAPSTHAEEELMRGTAQVEVVGDDSVRIEFEVDDDTPPGVVKACFLGDLDPRDQALFLGRWRPSVGRDVIEPIRLPPPALRALVRPGDAQSRRLSIQVDRETFDRMQGQPIVVRYAPTPSVEDVGCASSATPDSLVQAFDVDLELGRPSTVRPIEKSADSFLGRTGSVRSVGDSLRITIPIQQNAGDGTVFACLRSSFSDLERRHLDRRWFPDVRDSTAGRDNPVPAFVTERTVLGGRSLSLTIHADSTGVLEEGLIATQVELDDPTFVPDCSWRTFPGEFFALDLDLQSESRAGHAAGGAGLALVLIIALGGS